LVNYNNTKITSIFYNLQSLLLPSDIELASIEDCKPVEGYKYMQLTILLLKIIVNCQTIEIIVNCEFAILFAVFLKEATQIGTSTETSCCTDPVTFAVKLSDSKNFNDCFIFSNIPLPYDLIMEASWHQALKGLFLFLTFILVAFLKENSSTCSISVSINSGEQSELFFLIVNDIKIGVIVSLQMTGLIVVLRWLDHWMINIREQILVWAFLSWSMLKTILPKNNFGYVLLHDTLRLV
ncbi:hypothetical protein ACJX0J_015155, partial [Zea mays]